jgi:glycerol-3-phosphate dehydrogenase
MMSPPILRDPAAAATERYDLAIVGGGLQGIMLALEATRRRLRPVLLERGDFAALTSYNSLRILHGGLRYLQRLDLSRALESIRERAWWLRWFPDLVHTLPCLMPLYGEGPRRPRIMWSGLKVNDLLCTLATGPDDPSLPPGRIVGPDEVATLFPAVGRVGLQGGAIWYDAWAPNAPRLCLEAVRWAGAEGAVTLNRVEARGLVLSDHRVYGVRAHDLENETELVFEAPVVINAAGPLAAGFAALCGVRGGARGGRRPPATLAWNVAFQRPALSTHGLAVKRPGPDAQTHFVVPWKARLCAGTPYAPAAPDDPLAGPSDRQLAAFLDDLNRAIPGLDLASAEIAHVYAGLQPAAQAHGARPVDRAILVDHARSGGPSGLVSVTTPKLTTTRAVADRLLARLFPGEDAAPDDERTRPPAPPEADLTLDWEPGPEDDGWLRALRRASVRDAALHLDDLLLRHSALGDDPRRALRLAPRICDALGIEGARRERELARLNETIRPRLGPFADLDGTTPAERPA